MRFVPETPNVLRRPNWYLRSMLGGFQDMLRRL